MNIIRHHGIKEYEVVIELILLFLAYLAAVIFGSYYVNLYITRDQFSKEDLKNVFPYISDLWSGITSNNSLAALLGILIASSFVGILITMITRNWFLNSSIIFVILFLTFPLAKKSFEKARVTTGGGFGDRTVEVFAKYDSFILIGYGAGTGTALMYNWGVYKAVPFLWFLINFIVITILLGMVIKNVANPEVQ
jgi:hypothetical protein